jgi:hypothetical protein
MILVRERFNCLEQPLLSRDIIQMKHYLMGPVHMTEHMLKITLDCINALIDVHTKKYPTNSIEENMEANLAYHCNLKEIKGR